MNRINNLKWVANALVVLGAGVLAISPEYAKNSIIPFVCMVVGQVLAIYCCIKTKDYPYVGLSVCFICLDVYGIFVRLF